MGDFGYVSHINLINLTRRRAIGVTDGNAKTASK